MCSSQQKYNFHFTNHVENYLLLQVISPLPGVVIRIITIHKITSFSLIPILCKTKYKKEKEYLILLNIFNYIQTMYRQSL